MSLGGRGAEGRRRVVRGARSEGIAEHHAPGHETHVEERHRVGVRNDAPEPEPAKTPTQQTTSASQNERSAPFQSTARAAPGRPAKPSLAVGRTPSVARAGSARSLRARPGRARSPPHLIPRPCGPSGARERRTAAPRKPTPSSRRQGVGRSSEFGRTRAKSSDPTCVQQRDLIAPLGDAARPS